MKKSIKLSVSLFICSLMLLTGCTSTPSSSLPKDLAGKAVEKPTLINLIAPRFYSSQDEDVADLKKQWTDEMSERYGVEFNITSEEYKDGEHVTDAFGQTLNILYGQTSFPGLVSISVNNTLSKAIERGVAVPLEDYLAHNAVWKALPEEIKSMFEVDGHIYAIPASCSWYINARTIRNDAMQQTGITVTDLNSLRDFALALTKISDHENDALESNGLDFLRDILNAYGLYMDAYNNHSFTYDPTKDCIVDFLTKDSAITALEYLRELNKAGAIKMDFDYSTSPYMNFKDGISSTYYGGYGMEDNCTNVLTLNPAYPQVLDSYETGYIMTKDTPQPKETINFFVNMLFGSEENYLECWLGSADNYTLNSDGTITVKVTQDSEGKLKYSAKPNLTGGLPGVFSYSDSAIKYELNGSTTPEAAAQLEQTKQYQAIMGDALTRKLAVKIPAAYRLIHTTSFSGKQNDISYLFKKCIEDALTDEEYTVQQIVEQYRLDLLNMGGNQMLDEMNAAIGKKTAYYYG